MRRRRLLVLLATASLLLTSAPLGVDPIRAATSGVTVDLSLGNEIATGAVSDPDPAHARVTVSNRYHFWAGLDLQPPVGGAQLAPTTLGEDARGLYGLLGLIGPESTSAWAGTFDPGGGSQAVWLHYDLATPRGAQALALTSLTIVADTFGAPLLAKSHATVVGAITLLTDLDEFTDLLGAVQRNDPWEIAKAWSLLLQSGAGRDAIRLALAELGVIVTDGALKTLGSVVGLIDFARTLLDLLRAGLGGHTSGLVTFAVGGQAGGTTGPSQAPPATTPTVTPTSKPSAAATPRGGPTPSPISTDCSALQRAMRSLAPDTSAYRSNVSTQLADGCVVYMSTDTSLYLVDTASGTSTLVGDYGTGGMFDIARAPDGRMYGVSQGGGQFVSIDPWTAVATPVGATNAVLNGLTVAPDGTIYGSGGMSLYVVNPGTGLATEVGSTGMTSAGDLAASPSGLLVYASDVLATVDPMTANATPLGTTQISCLYGLSMTRAGLFGGTCEGELLRLHLSTGGYEVIATGLPGWYGAG